MSPYCSFAPITPFSLSVQNRRKSRVGLALENHLEVLFVENGLRYARTARTENKAKPDFLFPGVSDYHNPAYDPLKLTMLGVKSTCKDRWRQVLAEADAPFPLEHILNTRGRKSLGYRSPNEVFLTYLQAA